MSENEHDENLESAEETEAEAPEEAEVYRGDIERREHPIRDGSRRSL